jgi:hypothetical protein
MQQFVFDRVAALAAVQEFAEVYESRPLRTNAGGMGFNHSFAAWFMLRALRPNIVVESGVWRGHSTWIIESAAPQATVYCFDPRPDRRLYSSQRARYVVDDFSRFDWSQVDTGQAVLFCDDHQNSYERLKAGAWFGFRHYIFEDNFPTEEGDCYSVRQILAGSGHPHVQMSRKYAGRPKQVLKRLLIEPLLARIGAQQALVVPPNTADAANLRRRLSRHEEFPPVVRQETTHWGTSWRDGYESEEPLYPDLSAAAAVCGSRTHDWDWDYGYICYIELK